MTLNLILLSAFWSGVWTVTKWILIIISAALLIWGIVLMLDIDDDVVADGVMLSLYGAVLCTFWAVIIPYCSVWTMARWGLFALVGLGILVGIYCLLRPSIENAAQKRRASLLQELKSLSRVCPFRRMPSLTEKASTARSDSFERLAS